MQSTPTYAPEMVRITTYITKSQDTELNSMAGTTGRTKSELIRESINNFTTHDSDKELADFLADFQSGFAKYIKTTFQQFSHKAFNECIGPQTSYQINTCERLATFSRVIICAPRQCGLTSMLSMLAAYRAATKQCNIVVGTLAELRSVCYNRDITKYLGYINGITITKSTKTQIILSNKSTISLLSFGSKAFSDALSDATNEFILDEFAHAKPLTQMESIADKLIQNCQIPHFKLFIGSVPTNAIRYTDDRYPILTHFYRLWAYAMATDSPLRAIQIPTEATRATDFAKHIDTSIDAGKRRYTNEVDGTFYETSSDAFIDVIHSGEED